MNSVGSIRTTVRVSLLLCATLLLATSFIACGNNSADTTATAWEIPALKERAAGLDAGDGAMIERRADAMTALLLTDPNDVDALVGLAQIFMYEARVTGDHPYYYTAASSLLDRALTLRPDSYDAVLSKASVLLSLHHFAEARTVAERAVALAPERAAGYGALIDAEVELGNYAAAVTAADRMMVIRPDLKSYSRVSYLREIHGDGEGAIAAMRLAVGAGAPGSEERAWARTTLATLYLNEGDLDRADDEYAIAATERADYPFALAGRARIAAQRGDDDGALALLDRAIALVPEFSFVETQAAIHRASGNDAAADSLLVVIEQMLAEDEASGHAMDRELAMIYADHGVKLDEALRRATTELAKRPHNIDALDAMAYVLLRSGRADEAKGYSDRAMRTGARNAAMIARAGMIERALGRSAEAEELLRRAREITPYLPTLMRMRMRIEEEGTGPIAARSDR